MQVPLLTAELHKKDESLRKLEQDKMHFMGNLDRTMAQLTESVEKREQASIEEVKQAAEKQIRIVEAQWREKHKEHVEAAGVQIESLKLALEKAHDMHEYAVGSVQKDHLSERALQSAENEAALVSIQNKLHSELTAHRSNHNLEIEQIKTTYAHSNGQLEEELEASRQAATAARVEAAANQSSADNLAREKMGLGERTSELQRALDVARKDREDELRLAHATRSDAEGKHSEVALRHAELSAKHESVVEQLQKHEEAGVRERASTKAESEKLRGKLEVTLRELESVRGELKRFKGSTIKMSREKRVKLRADAGVIYRQVGQVREDCTVLRTEVQMKLEMMKNDVLRELGELQWYHKEDVSRVVGSLQSQSRTTKQIYEDKMDRFREQLEAEYAQAVERLKTVHHLEKEQLRVDMTAEKDEHIGKLKPELLEAQSRARTAQATAQQHKEHGETQIVTLQTQLSNVKRELDESRLAHTEANLEGTRNNDEFCVLYSK